MGMTLGLRLIDSNLRWDFDNNTNKFLVCSRTGARRAWQLKVNYAKILLENLTVCEYGLWHLKQFLNDI